MSDYEFHQGKAKLYLKETDDNIELLEATAKNLLNNVKLDSWCKSYLEMLNMESDDFYYVKGVGIFDLSQVKEKDIDFISAISKIGENEFDVILYFYNGGIGRNEAFEEEIRKIYNKGIQNE